MCRTKWKCIDSGAFLTLFIVIIGGTGKCSGQAEYFSSITGLESLLHTEELLLENLRTYVQTSRWQLDTLERELQRIEEEHRQASVDTENYVTNPINVYRLIKRLTDDWNSYEDRIQNALNNAKYYLYQTAGYKETLNFPGEEDVDGSAAALSRLQETYQLDTSQLAAGILNGVKYGSSMTWQDCFTLGKHLFNLEMYNHTKLWLKESMQRLSSEPYRSDSTTLSSMEDVATRLLSLGDPDTALEIANQVLMLDRTRERAWHIKNTVLSPYAPRIAPLTEVADGYHQTDDYENYKKVCRGEVTASPSQLRPLRCRYDSNNNPYHRIAPFKVEEHNLDPLILTFHDFLSDTKIETIKSMAAPRMKRSTVRNVEEYKKIKQAKFRISKNSWLAYEEHPYTLDLLRDLNDITDLDITDCEQLQVANYGLGGHYEPHWDFFLETETIPYGRGNRIATAIFYLSDVEQGGATAFTYLKLAIKPKKGDVLFWYNLHSSLKGDYRTRHAGCPVLKGSKWIGNVWVSDKTQMFQKPCALHYDGEISRKYFTIK